MTRQRKTRRIRKHRGGEANRVRSHLIENIDKLRVLRRRSVTNKNLVKKLNNSIAHAEKLASETNNSKEEVSLKEKMDIAANKLEKLMPINITVTPEQIEEEKRLQQVNKQIKNHKEFKEYAREVNKQNRGVNKTTGQYSYAVPTLR